MQGASSLKLLPPWHLLHGGLYPVTKSQRKPSILQVPFVKYFVAAERKITNTKHCYPQGHRCWGPSDHVAFRAYQLLHGLKRHSAADQITHSWKTMISSIKPVCSYSFISDRVTGSVSALVKTWEACLRPSATSLCCNFLELNTTMSVLWTCKQRMWPF